MTVSKVNQHPVRCPMCNRFSGKIGKGRYYCQECFIEFTADTTGNVKKAFKIDQKGCLEEIKSIPTAS